MTGPGGGNDLLAAARACLDAGDRAGAVSLCEQVADAARVQDDVGSLVAAATLLPPPDPGDWRLAVRQRHPSWLEVTFASFPEPVATTVTALLADPSHPTSKPLPTRCRAWRPCPYGCEIWWHP